MIEWLSRQSIGIDWNVPSVRMAIFWQNNFRRETNYFVQGPADNSATSYRSSGGQCGKCIASAIWSDARGQLRLNRTARIPRTYVSRSTAPHFNRPMHIRPSLTTRLTSQSVRRNAQRPKLQSRPVAHRSRIAPRVDCTLHFFEIKAELEFTCYTRFKVATIKFPFYLVSLWKIFKYIYETDIAIFMKESHCEFIRSFDSFKKWSWKQ